jgi:hypothetical protein
LLETKGIISPAPNAMEKSRTAPPASVRGAGGVADAVLIAANLNTASGGKRGGPLNEIHRLPARPLPLNSILETTRPEARIALRAGVGKRVFGFEHDYEQSEPVFRRSCSNKIGRDDYSRKFITL